MAHQFTRKELYKLVWSEPMTALAQRFSISSAGLSKVCKRYRIPTPPRGYWARLRAGKKVQGIPLPSREPGMSDEVVVGVANRQTHRYSLSESDILQASPSPPLFEKEMEAVSAEVRAKVGHVTVPRVLKKPHRLIRKLMDEDEDRLRRMSGGEHLFSWEQAQFGSPFEKRRLRLLNAIFIALERHGARPSLSGGDGRNLWVRVNDENVSLGVDDANMIRSRRYGEYDRDGKPSGRMKVLIGDTRPADLAGPSWEDSKDSRVEQFASDIVAGLIIEGERQYRWGMQDYYEWILRRKAQIAEKARKEIEEAERRERERLARLERDRVARLLTDAAALRQAQAIREYVRKVKDQCEDDSHSSRKEIRAWEKWALAQADRIDPALNLRFLESANDPAIEEGTPDSVGP